MIFLNLTVDFPLIPGTASDLLKKIAKCKVKYVFLAYSVISLAYDRNEELRVFYRKYAKYLTDPIIDPGMISTELALHTFS